MSFNTKIRILSSAEHVFHLINDPEQQKGWQDGQLDIRIPSDFSYAERPKEGNSGNDI